MLCVVPLITTWVATVTIEPVALLVHFKQIQRLQLMTAKSCHGSFLLDTDSTSMMLADAFCLLTPSRHSVVLLQTLSMLQG